MRALQRRSLNGIMNGESLTRVVIKAALAAKKSGQPKMGWRYALRLKLMFKAAATAAEGNQIMPPNVIFDLSFIF